ncbi:DUF4306 domain-containing protein [Rossellomorea vietnamensis]|uniref:DUF4306 domain-containing protein n=1 Tax=Rossellomorea vietnamensis TaxID=218284 RepID=A0A6I6UJP7_9BACI|nr:DUF4306 domain-containing protein [Rossellomorea vietnamensis]QHE61607.1 DUF4306 domain-containing protein [Rossellomorea vietnamensis]
MSIKYWSQVGIGLLVLGFSTLVSWYEGSALLDHAWEWRYSAPFSGGSTSEAVTTRNKE